MVVEEELQKAQREEKKETKTAASHKYVSTSVMAPAGIKGHQKPQTRSTEEVLKLYWHIIHPAGLRV